MAEDGKEIQPIIKKIKKGGHGHHGGAWKVAYADFVTAMMAFFLLLWLLSSTTDEQKKGIADYFTPTVGIAGEQGVGTQGGVSSVEGTRKDELSPPGIVFGAPPTGPIVQNPESTEAEDQAEEEKRMEELAEQIKKGLIEDKEFGQFKQNLLVEQTPEGLRIQIVDQENRSMFEKGSYVLADYAKVILEKLSPILMRMPNRLAIAGHTDAAKYGISTSYTNWELSADRANATRRFLLTTKMPETKIAIVSGRADTEPLIVQDRLSPGNRRMSITLLYRHIAPYEVPATDELFRPPGSKPDGPTPNIRIPTE